MTLHLMTTVIHIHKDSFRQGLVFKEVDPNAGREAETEAEAYSDNKRRALIKKQTDQVGRENKV